ncbi:MAG: conjugal transfer protein TraH [Pseudoalteromonas sp.]|uniref:conjugal transfer protein TraH n=1 Tax=Pseudoalteromonas sp. TaxID=53249 RepID=UPI001DD3462F|nr:conjugal transfer protein TraH [Pseudoalteromonas sp.]NRA79378.1 conjugal transfer protein TraH [Pseudoalteromonas sp.]
MFKINKLTVLIALSALSPSIHASTVMEDVFTEAVTFQTTTATSFSTPTRNGISFGGASYRVKGVRANVVNFQPPKISGGCGGIDFFAGSFSLINSDQLVQMGRAIAQGVPSYAFNLALTSVCPSCSKLMSDLQTKLDEFNQMTANGCEKAVGYLGDLKLDDGTNAVDTFKSSVQFGALEGLANDASGWLTDRGEANATKGDTDNTAVKAEKNGVEVEVNTAHHILVNANVSAYTHSSISGLGGANLKDLIMSLTGTTISRKSGSTSSTDTGVDVITKPATVSLRDIFEESDTGSIRVMKCESTDPNCLNPIEQTISSRGLKYIFDDIAEKLVAKIDKRLNVAQTADEIALQAIADLNASELVSALKNPRLAAKTLSLTAQEAVAQQIITVLQEVLHNIKSNSSVGVSLKGAVAKSYIESLDKLNDDLDKMRYKIGEDLKLVATPYAVTQAMK